MGLAAALTGTTVSVPTLETAAARTMTAALTAHTVSTPNVPMATVPLEATRQASVLMELVVRQAGAAIPAAEHNLEAAAASMATARAILIFAKPPCALTEIARPEMTVEIPAPKAQSTPKYLR